MWRVAGLLAGAAALAYGAGFGAGWFLGREGEPAPAAAAGTADPDAPPAAGSVRPIGYYVEAGQFVVPVLIAGKTLAFVLAQVTVEVGGPSEADRLRRQLPHVRNALLQGLYGLAGSGAFEGEAPDLPAVARTLRDRMNEDLGGGVARAVLFDRLLRQPNSRA